MVGLAGALTALLLFEVAPAAGGAGAVPTTITVTAGKPTELKFTLSKKTVPLGTVVFKVVNKGKKPHSFTIAGKTTKSIPPGKSATLRIVFTKAGSFAYRFSVAGQSAMKGVFVVSKPATTTTTTPVPLPACANPVTSTVNVTLNEFTIMLSQASIPCGTATFNVTNAGAVNHNFSLPGGTSPVLTGGGSAALTVNFTQPGSVTYLCTQGNHAGQGMIGTLTVT